MHASRAFVYLRLARRAQQQMASNPISLPAFARTEHGIVRCDAVQMLPRLSGMALLNSTRVAPPRDCPVHAFFVHMFKTNPSARQTMTASVLQHQKQMATQYRVSIPVVPPAPFVSFYAPYTGDAGAPSTFDSGNLEILARVMIAAITPVAPEAKRILVAASEAQTRFEEDLRHLLMTDSRLSRLRAIAVGRERESEHDIAELVERFSSRDVSISRAGSKRRASSSDSGSCSEDFGDVPFESWREACMAIRKEGPRQCTRLAVGKNSRKKLARMDAYDDQYDAEGAYTRADAEDDGLETVALRIVEHQRAVLDILFAGISEVFGGAGAFMLDVAPEAVPAELLARCREQNRLMAYVRSRHAVVESPVTCCMRETEYDEEAKCETYAKDPPTAASFATDDMYRAPGKEVSLTPRWYALDRVLEVVTPEALAAFAVWCMRVSLIRVRVEIDGETHKDEDME